MTGHIATSLGLESVTTVVDAWNEDLEEERSERSLIDIATQHQNGLTVCVLTASPLNTEVLEPERVGDAIRAARRGFDFIIVDMHPSYSPLNQADLPARPTGSSCRSRRTCRPSGPPSRCATSRRSWAFATSWPWSSTGRTAACRWPTWSGPWGCRPWP